LDSANRSGSDQQADQQFQQEARAMVEQQMKSMVQESQSKDYLKDFPMPSLSKLESPLIQAEIERVTNKASSQALIDTYADVKAPAEDETDIKKWRESIDKASINFTVAEQR
jgi:hypothetical protein